jgi:hypothetical protein
MLPRKTHRWFLLTATALVLAGCGGGANMENERGKGLFNFHASAEAGGSGPGEPGSGPGTPANGPLQEFASKVSACSNGDTPETGLQGQVPAALRVAGFKGFSCNLELVGQFAGEGGNWSSAVSTDNAGRHCAYHSTAANRPGRINPGVPVIDITDPTRPVRTMSLTTPAMMNPWESLRASPVRQMLFADNGLDIAGIGGPDFDVYDLSADCRTPQLLSTTPFANAMGVPINGHEGNISPDGLTYYIGDLIGGVYHAVDVTNATRPKIISTYAMSESPIAKGPHGLSISKDGNRAYVAAAVATTPLDMLNPSATPTNGFLVLDTSEVQARKPGAKMKVVSSAAFYDGSNAQHTVLAKINGKTHLVMVDEGGSAGLSNAASIQSACQAGQSPFPLARIYDLTDEAKPKLVSKLKLETHDVKHCSTVLPDVSDLAVFTYGSHYCSVDDAENTTALACSYFNSGIRVFDIRNPAQPKEIAYFNPPGATVPQLGSDHTTLGQFRPGGADWCASRLDFDKARGLLTTMCQDNGLLVMKFRNGVWPFK